jgi:regulator of replication initiation timing
MNQELVVNELNALERKLSLLIKDHQLLKEQAQGLLEENQELKMFVSQKEEQLTVFHNKVKIGKLVNNIEADNNDSAELKKKLDDYIKEIDKCIAHLSN